MLRELLGFFINGIVQVFNLTKNFILDNKSGSNITLYHFIIALIFMTITIRLINFIKGIQEIENENKYEIKKERSKRK